MTCSLDLKERVVEFVRSGGSKAEAARRFSVSRRSIYYWLGLDDLSPKPAASRHRKIDKVRLREHVTAHPEMLLRERAKVFGVSVPGLSIALKTMKIVKKTKNDMWSGTL
ncbi:MAG: helix-turn-helix domain-containing protein [Rhodospirillales bacterium]|nr:helix-turn-helix domain-containing protein [Rhodospirillales bacterium]MCB9979896.1 helix-turn-helix domain-containing protein [Rhodospirillales bacterium]